MPTDTPEPLSDDVLDALLEVHGESALFGDRCRGCNQTHPCTQRRLGEALLAAREELEQAKADIMELMAEKLPDGTTLHRMVTTYPKMRQRMLSDADNEIAELRQRAEAAELEAANSRNALYVLNRKVEEERTKTRAAEADCAALREFIDDLWCEHDLADLRACCGALLNHTSKCILAQPNPGAGVLERLRLLEAENEVLRRIAPEVARLSGELEKAKHRIRRLEVEVRDERACSDQFLSQLNEAWALLTEEQLEGLLGPTIPDIGEEGDTDESELGNDRSGRPATEGDPQAYGAIWAGDTHGRSGVLSTGDGGLTRHDPARLAALAQAGEQEQAT